MMPIEPTREQIAEIAAAAGQGDDGPVVMLNLNRYRERAAYEDVPEGVDPDVSGHEAYARYAAVATAILARLDARILWHAAVERTVIGDESDVYDEVIAVWYPSRRAFVELATHEEVLPALAHRVAGLERAALICCESGPEAALRGV
jgi:uncharacterized protein (DUF1330 family)